MEHIISAQPSELVLQIRSKKDSERYILQIYSFSFQLARLAKKLPSRHHSLILLHEKNFLLLLSPSQIEFFPKDAAQEKNSFHFKYLPYVIFLLCSCLFLYSIHNALQKKGTETVIAKHPDIAALNDNQKAKGITTGSALSTNAALSPVTSSSAITSFPDTTAVSHQCLDLQAQNLTNASFKRKIENAYDITILAASYNQLTACQDIPMLSQLQELYLNANKITSIQQLSDCKNLSILVLADNQIQNIDALKKLTKLTILDLSGNKKLSGIRCLSSLTKLQYLLLQNTGCDQEEISYLQKKLPSCTIFY